MQRRMHETLSLLFGNQGTLMLPVPDDKWLIPTDQAEIRMIYALFWPFIWASGYLFFLRINIILLPPTCGYNWIVFTYFVWSSSHFHIDVDTNPRSDPVEIKTEDFRVEKAVRKLFNWICNPTVDHEFLDCKESLPQNSGGLSIEWRGQLKMARPTCGIQRAIFQRNSI